MGYLTVEKFLGREIASSTTSHNFFSINRYKQNDCWDWHTHKHPCFAFFIRGGAIEERKKQILNCKAGNLLFYPKEAGHRNYSYSSNTTILHLEMKVSDSEEIGYAKALIDFVDEEAIKNIFRKVVKELFQPDCYSLLILEGLLLQLQGLMERQTTCNINHFEWTACLEEYFQETNIGDIKLAEAAKIVNLHPVTLSKIFTRHFGCDFSTYIVQLKLKKAEQLLSHSHLSIDQISFDCKFSDSSHFIRTFKKYYGLTPNAYRKLGRH